MNAHGIAIFYGSADPLIALAEVRPPVGSRVVVGRFEIIRKVCLLDVEALQSVNVVGSIFNRDYIHHLQRAKFLRGLSRRIIMPVMPDDEPFDYLATQAISDFLATEADPPLDRIIYPSVQTGEGEGKFNVALFHKASRVQPLDIPKGAAISAQLNHDTDDGSEIDYWVWEELLPETPPSDRSEIHDFLASEPLDNSWYENQDERFPTLKLDLDSLEVHHVTRVEFNSDSYSVHRHRLNRKDYKF
jgi:hypothetical protein